MAKQNKADTEQIRADRKAYLSGSHTPKPRTRDTRKAEPQAQPRGEGNEKKTTVTTGKKKAAGKKGS